MNQRTRFDPSRRPSKRALAKQNARLIGEVRYAVIARMSRHPAHAGQRSRRNASKAAVTAWNNAVNTEVARVIKVLEASA